MHLVVAKIINCIVAEGFSDVNYSYWFVFTLNSILLTIGRMVTHSLLINL